MIPSRGLYPPNNVDIPSESQLFSGLSTRTSSVYLSPNWQGGQPSRFAYNQRRNNQEQASQPGSIHPRNNIGGRFTHFKPMVPWPTHACSTRAQNQGQYLPKFPRFVSVVGSNIFVQQLNFPHPSFPHHCNKRPLGALHIVPVQVLGLPPPSTYV